MSGVSIQYDRTQEKEQCGVDDNSTLGCVCGTTGKAFGLKMGMKVTWSHEREVVPGYPGEPEP